MSIATYIILLTMNSANVKVDYFDTVKVYIEAQKYSDAYRFIDGLLPHVEDKADSVNLLLLKASLYYIEEKDDSVIDNISKILIIDPPKFLQNSSEAIPKKFKFLRKFYRKARERALNKLETDLSKNPNFISLVEDTVFFTRENPYPEIHISLNWPSQYEKFKSIARIEYTIGGYRFLVPTNALANTKFIPLKLSSYMVNPDTINEIFIELFIDTMLISREKLQFFVSKKRGDMTFISENYWLPTLYAAMRLGKSEGKNFICTDIGGGYHWSNGLWSLGINLSMGVDYKSGEGTGAGIRDVGVEITRIFNIGDRSAVSVGGIVTIPSFSNETPLRALSTKTIDMGFKFKFNYLLTDESSLELSLVPMDREFIMGDVGPESNEINITMGYKTPQYWIYGKGEIFLFQIIRYPGDGKVPPNSYGKSEFSFGGKFKLSHSLIAGVEFYPFKRIPEGIVPDRKIWLPNGNTLVKFEMGIMLR